MWNRAVTIAKAAFEGQLAQLGKVAEWKKRTPRHSQTAGRVSAAANRADPADSGWVRELDNPQLYEPQGEVRVIHDVPSELQSEQVGKLLTGTATAYASLDTPIATGDVLKIEGVNWYVDAAREQLPYLEMTLRREV